MFAGVGQLIRDGVRFDEFTLPIALNEPKFGKAYKCTL